MKNLVNICLSLTNVGHLAARESGKCVLLVEHTAARKHYSRLYYQYYLFCFVFFETESMYVVLATLELTMQINMALKSEIFLPLPPKFWIKGLEHQNRTPSDQRSEIFGIRPTFCNVDKVFSMSNQRLVLFCFLEFPWHFSYLVANHIEKFCGIMEEEVEKVENAFHLYVESPKAD